MKTYRTTVTAVALPLLVTGFLAIPPALCAEGGADSQEISKLLNNAKVEAFELKSDSADLEAFTRTTKAWEAFAEKLDMIKGHVNRTGQFLSKLQNIKESGSVWQQMAIRRVEPLLKELADNTNVTILHLNKHQDQVHMPPMRDYVKANFEVATDLEGLIRDFVDYGHHKGNVERLAMKLEIPQ